MPAEVCALRYPDGVLASLFYDTTEVTDCICAAITNQKDALLALKEGLINNDASKLTDWVTTTDPCTGEWTKITCDGGKVTGIDLCK